MFMAEPSLGAVPNNHLLFDVLLKLGIFGRGAVGGKESLADSQHFGNRGLRGCYCLVGAGEILPTSQRENAIFCFPSLQMRGDPLGSLMYGARTPPHATLGGVGGYVKLADTWGPHDGA